MLEKVLELVQAGRRPEAIDLVYDTMDEWLLAGNWDAARQQLRAAVDEYERFPKSVLLSLMIVTGPWRGELGEPREHLAQLILASGEPHYR